MLALFKSLVGRLFSHSAKQNFSKGTTMAGKLSYQTGINLFDVLPDTGVCIAHVCNDLGIAGGGFVIPLERKFPETIRRYRAWAENKTELRPDNTPLEFTLGKTQFIEVSKKPHIVVANMVAQHKFPSPENPVAVQYDQLKLCLQQVAEHCDPKKVQLHCPKFGSGIGGGDWGKIEPLVKECWVKKGYKVTIYSL